MSDNEDNSSRDADAERKRKGKSIMLSDDEQEETNDDIKNITNEDLSSVFHKLVQSGRRQQALQLPESLDDETLKQNPYGISNKNLGIYHMAFQIDRGGHFDDFVRRQIQDLSLTTGSNDDSVQSQQQALQLLESLDDERKETVEDKTLKQNPYGISDEDLAIYRMAIEIEVLE